MDSLCKLLFISTEGPVLDLRLSESQIAYIKVLIEKYVEMRQELFPHVNLRPKHYYADLTLQFAPLIHTWTMRHESKHSYFKGCIRSSKNLKNVTKSLAHRHQLFQAYQGCGSLFGPQVQFSGSTSFYPDLYDRVIRKAVADFGLTSLNSIVTDKVQVKGTSYTNGMYVLLKYTKRQLQLREITSSFIKSEVTVLILLQRKTASWVPELGVYEMDRDSFDTPTCKNLDKLIDYTLLAFYPRGKRLLLLLKHIPLWSL